MLVDDIWIQKLDLNLRNKFPGLKTQIGYEIDSGHKYYIHCLNYKKFIKDIEKYVRHNAMASLWVQVTIESINENEIIIKGLSNEDVANNLIGNLITTNDVFVYLINKFPNINFKNYKNTDKSLFIYVDKKTTDIEIAKIEKELKINGFDDVGKVIRCLENEEEIDNKKSHFDESYYVYHLNPSKKFAFLRNEEDFWHENVEKIYDGTCQKENLPFFNSASTKCYFDFSVFDNIDLRNALLLYDEIYMALPLGDKMKNFYESQNITKENLMELIEMERIKVILTNNEDRYDKKLLNDIYNCNDKFIVGRRGINVLLAMLFTELEFKHRQRNPHFEKLAKIFFETGKEQDNTFFMDCVNFLMWPTRAKQESIRTFVNYGPLSIANFGVQEIINVNTDDKKLKDNISFELTVNSLAPHIAAALNATYFPFLQDDKYSDAVIANHLGNLFKFYKYGIKYFDKLKEKNFDKEYNLEILQVNKDIDIVKFAEMTREENTIEKFSNILKNLSNMELEQQKDTIKSYNNILLEFSRQVSKKNTNNINKVSIILDLLSLIFALPTPITFFIGIIILARDSQLIKPFFQDKLTQDIQELLKKYDNENLKVEDILLLDRIAPAVQLKST